MDILKYFYEEPASLEALSPNLDADARRHGGPARSLDDLLRGPRYYRGYLAGTDLATGRVGLTALAHPEAFVDPLLDLLGRTGWTVETTDGASRRLDPADVPDALRAPLATAVLARSEAPLPAADLAAAGGADRRYAVPALRRLLDAGAFVALPEPAHHGFDWSFFAAHSVRELLTDALRRHPVAGVRRFVLPFQQARSEAKFYFESHALDQYLDYELT